MTVLQNVIQTPIHVLGVIKAAAVEKEEAMLHRVGLFDKRDQLPASLSAGQHPKRNQRHEECPQNVFVLCSRSS
jgi:polar amino acid transport system ATP-binding protein